MDIVLYFNIMFKLLLKMRYFKDVQDEKNQLFKYKQTRFEI